MWLRANMILAIAVVFAIVQMFASVTGGPRIGDSNALASSPNSGLTRSVAAQDDDNDDDEDDNDDEDDDDNDDEDDSDNDEDDDDDNDEDDDDDNDEDDSDNDEDDSDNDDEDDSDNDEDDSDNDEDDSDNDDEDDSDNDDEDIDDELDDELDNVETDAGIAAAPTATPTTAPAAAAPSTTTQGVGTASASPVASQQPVTEAQMVTTGMDATLALQTDRVMLQVFATMPADITLKLRIVDPLLYPATPGIRAGDLIFQLEATDSMGVVQPTLPGEVNLSVRYTDIDVTGLDDTAITLGWLDAFNGAWMTAPKLVTDPMTNYLAASVTATGVYAVYVP